MATGIFTCYTHVYMKVLNCGYIYRVAMDIEVYTSGDVYMESILVTAFIVCLFISFGLGCNEFACRYANHECVD